MYFFLITVTMRVLFAIILGSGYLATVTKGTCFQENCPNVGYFFAVGKNIVDKHFLRHSVISKFTVVEPIECFRKCRLECQCISFNYWTTKNEDNCELNYENRYLKPSKLKLQVGAQYYDLVMAYNVVVSFTVLLRLYITRSAQCSLSVNFSLCFVNCMRKNVEWKHERCFGFIFKSKDSSIVEEENFILYIISLRSA